MLLARLLDRRARGWVLVLDRLADRFKERQVQAMGRRCHVLEVREHAAGCQKVEDFAVGPALAVVLDMVDRERRDDGVEAPERGIVHSLGAMLALLRCGSLARECAVGYADPRAMAEHASHPVCARIYARVAEISERRGGAEHRRKLLAGLQGRVVEVGAGSGANFQHYPTSVSEVVAVEPEPYLRERAERAASEAPVSVSVAHGGADRLPGEAESFDAGVVALARPAPRGVTLAPRGGARVRILDRRAGARVQAAAATVA